MKKYQKKYQKIPAKESKGGQFGTNSHEPLTAALKSGCMKDSSL
jgi:hypothetical protein